MEGDTEIRLEPKWLRDTNDAVGKCQSPYEQKRTTYMCQSAKVHTNGNIGRCEKVPKTIQTTIMHAFCDPEAIRDDSSAVGHAKSAAAHATKAGIQLLDTSRSCLKACWGLLGAHSILPAHWVLLGPLGAS